MAHYEASHQDLRCLEIQLFLYLVLKELRQTFLYVIGKALSDQLSCTQTGHDMIVLEEETEKTCSDLGIYSKLSISGTLISQSTLLYLGI